MSIHHIYSIFNICLALYYWATSNFITTVTAVEVEDIYRYSSKRAQDALKECEPNHS
jgi:hypothetical protein